MTWERVDRTGEETRPRRTASRMRGDARRRGWGAGRERSSAMVFTRAGWIALLIGPFLALGGLWRPELVDVGLAWTGGVALLGFLDAMMARATTRLEVERHFEDPLSLNARNPMTLTVRNQSWRGADLDVLDDLPDPLRPKDNRGRVQVAAHGLGSMAFEVRPAERGKFELGEVFVRGRALLGLSSWQRRYKIGGEARVYPSLADLRRWDYLTHARRLQEAGYRPLRRPGEGREFESLRDYVPDDDFRDIDWKATARKFKPITRQYEAERSQNLILLLDCGRMMAAETEGMTKLDHAVNAALMMAHVATAMDDAVGWIAFSEQILRMRPPRRAKDQVARLADDLYELKVELVEPNYVAAFAPLRSRMRKRALVAVFTDIVDLEASERLVAYSASLFPAHLPLLIAIRDAELETISMAAPGRPEDVYSAAVATRLLERRSLALAAMRRRGALVLDVAPHEITTRAVNEYLAVKAAGRL